MATFPQDHILSSSKAAPSAPRLTPPSALGVESRSQGHKTAHPSPPAPSCSPEKLDVSMAFRESKEKGQPWGKGPGLPSFGHEPAQKLPRENPSGLCIPAPSLGPGGALGVCEPRDLQALGPASHGTKSLKVSSGKMRTASADDPRGLEPHARRYTKGPRGMMWASTNTSG